MGRRIVAIICIMFLLFTITSPISGSIFSYADEPQQEQLSQDEVIKAAIALYLNERKAWITSNTSTPIEAVQNQMQIWIDSYDFWTNHTTIGSAAEFYAQCIVKYNPFRISLKGPAVRALNDLYDWLVSTGKLGNLENDQSGGITSDPLYQGFSSSGTLYYCYERSTLSSGYVTSSSNVKLGVPVRGNRGDILYNQFLNTNHISSSDFLDRSKSPTWNPVPLTVNYFADVSHTFYMYRYNDNRNQEYVNYYRPLLYLGESMTTNVGAYGNLLCGGIYAAYDHQMRGNPAYICRTYNGVNTFYYGWAAVDYTNNTVGLYHVNTIDTASHPPQATTVNFETDDFNKTNPTPPEGDDEVTYTPEDKTTGDTYNTYNEYITNYVTKNTVVNNNNSGGGDNPSGGTTPPWDGGNTTVTPDGDGFNLNLPDLTLPDLDIDWSINGLKDKFPFSIPWDLMAFFTVLNAEPETPEFTGEVDLGISIWNIDIDLHDFDLVAALVRNLEFIAFCIGLIIVTRSIIKG